MQYHFALSLKTVARTYLSGSILILFWQVMLTSKNKGSRVWALNNLDAGDKVLVRSRLSGDWAPLLVGYLLVSQLLWPS